MDPTRFINTENVWVCPHRPGSTRTQIDIRYFIIIIIIIIIIISFMQGIYTYIPETNYVPREYSVAAILLLFMVLIIIIIIIIIILLVGRDSVVGTETSYELDGSGIESRWGRDYLHPFRPTVGYTQPPIHWAPGLFPGDTAVEA